MLKNRLYKILLLEVAFLGVAGCSTIGPHGLTSLLGEYGYSELRPPSTLAPPGTIVYVRNTSPYEVSVVCPPNEAFGANFAPLESPSKDAKLISRATGSFDLSASYLNMIKAEARYSSVKTIKASLSNVSVPIVTDVLVVKNVSNRADSCIKAIDGRRRAGYPLTVIESVLKADVSYSIDFEDQATLTLEAKKELIKGLSPRLAADSSTATSESVSGTSLYWGVIDDPYLLTITPSTPVQLTSGSIKKAEDVTPSEVIFKTVTRPTLPVRLIMPASHMSGEAVMIK